MHREVLTKEQICLLPLLKSFSRDFGLVGGTAIALHIGHRRSIDFDLFTNKEFNNLRIREKVLKGGKIDRIFVNSEGEYTIVVNKVKITFFHYPFEIKFKEKFEGIIKTADLLTLAALKAYALGRRAKWKDYVDLYFIMKHYHGIEKIIKKAKQIFRSEFNEKLFRAQLAFFKDIDYSEKIIYMKGVKPDDKVIKKELINFSLR